MSDKFVVSTNEIGEIIVTDVETGKVYNNIYKFFGLIRLLNEQQSTITDLKEENEHLRKRVKAISDELYCKDRKLEELGIPIECCDKDE